MGEPFKFVKLNILQKLNVLSSWLHILQKENIKLMYLVHLSLCTLRKYFLKKFKTIINFSLFKTLKFFLYLLGYTLNRFLFGAKKACFWVGSRTLFIPHTCITMWLSMHAWNVIQINKRYRQGNLHYFWSITRFLIMVGYASNSANFIILLGDLAIMIITNDSQIEEND